MRRRRFFKAGAALAVAAASPLLSRTGDAEQRPQPPEDGGTLEPSWRQRTAPNQRLLLKGGTIVSLVHNSGPPGVCSAPAAGPVTCIYESLGVGTPAQST